MKLRKIGLTLFVLLLVIGFFTGCGDKKETTAKADKIVWLTTGDGGAKPILQNDRVISFINKKLDIDLVVNVVPENNVEKVNVAMASGDLPDIVTGAYGKAATQKWIDTGMLVALDPYFNASPAIKEILTGEYAFTVAKDGKYYGVPFITQRNTSNQTFAFRQDWLDNLGLKVPETLDEFTKTFVAFTNNDPDKNGKADTIGLTVTGNKNMDLFDFAFYAYGRKYADFAVDASGTLVSVYEEPAFKQGMAYLANLWQLGVIDKEFMMNDNIKGEEKFYKGRAGFFIPPLFRHVSRIENNLKSVTPSAKLGFCLPPKGPNGDFGLGRQGVMGFLTAVTVNCKTPDKAVAFIEFMNSQEGQDLVRYGIEGVHYTKEGDKIVYNEDERAKDNFSPNGWAHPLAWGSFFWPLEANYLPETEPERERALDSVRVATLAQKPNIIPAAFDAKIKYENALIDIYNQYFIDMLQGKLFIDKGTEELIAKWRSQGGNEVLKEANEIYKTMKK